MKMESAKVCGLLAANFLLLTLLMDPTAACSCFPPVPVKAYCTSDFLLKAQVLDVYVKKSERRYKINVTKVFKGPKALKRLRYLYTAREESLCGYEHPTPFNKDEYFFSMERTGNRMTISLCDVHEKWNDLSQFEKNIIEKSYPDMCH